MYINIIDNYRPLEFSKEGKPFVWSCQSRIIGENELRPVRGICRVLLRESTYNTLMDINIAEKLLKDQLTKREFEIIVLLNKAYRSTKIAGILNISLDTVKTHRRNINQKLKNQHLKELLFSSGLRI